MEPGSPLPETGREAGDGPGPEFPPLGSVILVISVCVLPKSRLTTQEEHPQLPCLFSWGCPGWRASFSGRHHGPSAWFTQPSMVRS